jgi:PIF1-like helicase
VVAPTGAAAALLGGMTYHSAFGINDRSTKDNASSVRARLVGVDYVFFDEVSMVSAYDLYRISEKLCTALNTPDISFGGLNMIFAGDFAQLPPPVGRESVSLYGRKHGFSGNSDWHQKAAIGKTLWHEVTTVVMLRKNMRQSAMSSEDDKLRTALVNMRYGACTPTDIAFLRSRVSTNIPGLSSVADAEFRDVSIITTRNVLKDTINELGSKRFAEETGQSLCFFYSEDVKALKNQFSDGRQKKINQNADFNSPQLQNALWNQPCSCTDKLIPGRIGLCVGLPVMIRSNSATELCITKGQEGHVYGWQSTVGTKGQPMIETLFVELSNPPREVCFAGLPKNVVPVLPTTTYGVQCSLHDGSKVFVNRTQVEVLPNFAMTDFSSQGKTRPFNVIDALSCADHQSFYTALSRGSTANGTLILQNFSPQCITRGINSGLRREFRSLEILDEITDLKYNGDLPEFVDGTHRKDLIAAFRAWRGNKYVPKHTHKAIAWNKCTLGEEWEDDESPIEPWKVVSSQKKKENTSQPQPLEGADVFVLESGSQVLPLVREMPSSLKAHHTDNLKRSGTPDISPSERPKRMRQREGESSRQLTRRPIGIVWSCNSCSFDSLLVLLHYVWTESPDRWNNYLRCDDRPYMSNLLNSFSAMARGETTFELGRDSLRHLLSTRPSNEFAFGRYTSPADIFYYLALSARSNGLTSYRQRTCEACFAQVGNTPACIQENSLNINGAYTSTQAYIDGSYRWVSSHNKCPCCGSASVMRRWYYESPGMVFMHVSADALLDISPMINIRTIGNNLELRLKGIIYFGGDHFTSRIISSTNRVWYHDGITTGASVEDEGQLSDGVDLTRCRGERVPCDILYCKAYEIE